LESVESFLSKVATATHHLPPLETLVILPTQRACYDYKQLLGNKAEAPLLLPSVVPIGNLLEKLNAPPVADDITLLVTLHQTYSELHRIIPFRDFIPFGEQVLDTFNEIDRQLVDASALFQQLLDLKRIDEAFSGDEEEQYEQFKRFWSSFLNTPHTPLQTNFLKYWEELGPLYTAYRKRLEQEGFTYEGLAWKIVSETVEKQAYFSAFKHLVFAGFYALNTTEEVLFEKLTKRLNLLVYKDADRLYTENQRHEAGRYFKRGLLSSKELPWTGDHFSVPKERYEVIGCNGVYATSLQLCNDIQIHYTQNPKARLAVVLTDESLLFPLLQCGNKLGLPLNPSMGFSLSLHPVFNLLKLVAQCRPIGQHEINEVLVERCLTVFLEEPIVRDNHREKDLSRLSESIRSWLGIVPESPDNEGVLLLDFLHALTFDKNEWMFTLHSHMLLHTEAAVERLGTCADIPDSPSWWELLIRQLKSVRISFETSPEGIPVMGFLETRVLDFDSVFIATLNEGTLPSSAVSSSLIPYALRKAYRLPCREEQQAVTAYHFYRLLQRAQNIHLYYNVQLNSMGAGEKSRYLYQLNLDVIRKYPPLSVRYLNQSPKINPPGSGAFEITKTAEILDKIVSKYIDTPENRDKKLGLSATVLRMYSECSMKFYLSKVAGLRNDKTPDYIDKPTFGTILHRAMELAYPINTLLTKEYIQLRINNIDELLETAIQDTYGRNTQYGHDYLMKGVLKKLIKNIMDLDMRQPGFTLEGSEVELNTSLDLPNGTRLLLKGNIDRLERRGGYLNIIDYKTGNDKIRDKPPEKLLEKSEDKTEFQLLFYALLIRKTKGLHETIRSGIMKLKSNEQIYLNEGEAVTSEQLESFEQLITGLITELLDPAVPFRMTADSKPCTYCDFNVLCQRKSA
jgi:RecB family exonuclease